MLLASKTNKHGAFCHLQNNHSVKQWFREDTDNRKAIWCAVLYVQVQVTNARLLLAVVTTHPTDWVSLEGCALDRDIS